MNAEMSKRHIYIYSAKDISQNRRIPLIASFFADIGCDVTVLTYSYPHKSYEDKRVEYITIDKPVFLSRLLGWMEVSEIRGASPFRKRQSGRVLSFFISIAEFLKNLLRKPATAILLSIYKSRLSPASIRYAKERGHYAFVLRHIFGARLSQKSRQNFERKLIKHLTSCVDETAVLFCHDRFSAYTTLKLQDAVERVVFDLVELISHRSNLSLQVKSSVNLKEIKSANLLLSSSLILTVSQAIADRLDETQIAHTHIIENGRLRKDWCAKMELGTGEQILLAYSGAFIPNSGLENILFCLSHLPGHYSLILAGYYSNKDYELQIEDIIRSLNLCQRITFHYKPDVTELPKVLSAADFYLIPFNPDLENMQVSMPNRLFDAIAAGLPVLGHKGLYLSEYVKLHNIGQAIDFRTPDDAAAQIEELAVNPAASLWRKNVRRVFDETCWEKQIEKLKLIFADDILAKKDDI